MLLWKIIDPSPPGADGAGHRRRTRWSRNAETAGYCGPTAGPERAGSPRPRARTEAAPAGPGTSPDRSRCRRRERRCRLNVRRPGGNHRGRGRWPAPGSREIM